MSRPEITVIVAVMNGERFLAQALESIRAQDYENYEVLVVDGKSTDRTVEIAEEAGVRVIRQSGTGVGNAYNSGVQASRGPLLAFLSHDDLWRPNKLSTQVSMLDGDPQLEIVFGHVEFFLEPGYTCPPGFRKDLLRGRHPGRIMETLLGRREVFDRIGPYDEELPFAEDADWFGRADCLGVKTAMPDQVVLEKRVHDANISLAPERSAAVMLEVFRRQIRRKRRIRDNEDQ